MSLQGLLSEQETLAMPAVIEGMFPLVPPGSSYQLSGAAQDTEPGVGVSVSLRLEQQNVMGNVASASSPILAGGGRGIPSGQVTEHENLLQSVFQRGVSGKKPEKAGCLMASLF